MINNDISSKWICDMSSVRGCLKHSHINNTYLLLGPSVLAATIAPDGATPWQSTRELFNDLLVDLNEGLSPKQLVDRLEPFEVLSKDDKNEFKKKLHKLFEEGFPLNQIKMDLTETGNRFFEFIEQFLKYADENKGIVLDGKHYENLKSAAQELHIILDRLPKWFWIP